MHKSIQKLLRHLRAPDRQPLVSRRPIPQWCVLIDQVPIRIMFHHISRCIPPVVEYLTSENMAANTPNRLVLLLHQPLMPESLGVEVMDLEAAMVHVGLPARRESSQEHGMVVDEILAAVDMCEHDDVLARRAVAVRGWGIQRNV